MFGLLGVLVLVVFVALAVLQAAPAPDPAPAPGPVVVQPATDSPMCVPSAPELVPPPPDCWSPDGL